MAFVTVIIAGRSKLVRQQKTLYHSFWIALNENQQEISWGCIVSRLFGGMQNAWAYCLLSSCELVL